MHFIANFISKFNCQKEFEKITHWKNPKRNELFKEGEGSSFPTSCFFPRFAEGFLIHVTKKQMYIYFITFRFIAKDKKIWLWQPFPCDFFKSMNSQENKLKKCLHQ